MSFDLLSRVFEYREILSTEDGDFVNNLNWLRQKWYIFFLLLLGFSNAV